MPDHSMSETWRPVAGFPGYYVSDAGAVGSTLYRKGNKVRIGGDLKMLRQDTHRKGYKTVSLAIEGRQVRRFVHRLVLEAFVGPRPDGMECAHADGSRANNRLSNLSWKTHHENEQDRVRHGQLLKGERCSWAKLTDADVLEIIRRHKAGESCSEIAPDFHVHKKTIQDVCRGRRWGHVTGLKL